MPSNVFWTRRDETQMKEGFMPLPDIHALPSHLHYLYPDIFTQSERSSDESKGALNNQNKFSEKVDTLSRSESLITIASDDESSHNFNSKTSDIDNDNSGEQIRQIVIDNCDSNDSIVNVVSDCDPNHDLVQNCTTFFDNDLSYNEAKRGDYTDLPINENCSKLEKKDDGLNLSTSPKQFSSHDPQLNSEKSFETKGLNEIGNTMTVILIFIWPFFLIRNFFFIGKINFR